VVESDQEVAHQDVPIGPIHGPGLVASREHAVNLVFKGGGLALLGVTIGLGADLFNVGMWGVLLIGGGLALLGRPLTGLEVGGTLLAPASAVVLVLSALLRWMSAGLVDDA